MLPGIITKIQGPVTHLIELEDEKVVCQHVDHVKLRVSLVEPVDEQVDACGRTVTFSHVRSF